MDEKVYDLMAKMYEEFSEFRKETKEEFSSLKGEVSSLKSEVTGLKNDVIRLENKMDDGLKALFDGYHQTYEKVVEVEKEVKGLSSKVEKQEVEIKVIKGGR